MKQRLQFDFEPDMVARLDRLVASRGATSRAEIVRIAIKLLDEIDINQAAGGNVALTQPDDKVVNLRFL